MAVKAKEVADQFVQILQEPAQIYSLLTCSLRSSSPPAQQVVALQVFASLAIHWFTNPRQDTTRDSWRSRRYEVSDVHTPAVRHGSFRNRAL